MFSGELGGRKTSTAVEQNFGSKLSRSFMGAGVFQMQNLEHGKQYAL